ncbi:MAG: FKBP-type peptidyl-prolyl cis-trans isomerase [Pseudoflavonifractor sp.]|nr:FKBP-type peptidyl-prolyl cis-trans isomerase [Alloprevotella sp.]MCM1116170.1 FKBP-type peptidyl-prolyl cis-trans isomerase [Pseudoflavonifractor sp.]
MTKFFRLLPALFALAILASALSACMKNNVWDDYETWRKDNNAWYEAQLHKTNPDGSPYYTILNPDWYPSSGVLIHYFNDRALTAANLSPLMNSTCDVVYCGRFYNDSIFDSSYALTAEYGDSIFRCQPSETIEGWQIALNDMHIGDSCEIIVPYTQAYGTYGSGSIPPYSTLKFNMMLRGIPGYEIPPAAVD